MCDAGSHLTPEVTLLCCLIFDHAIEWFFSPLSFLSHFVRTYSLLPSLCARDISHN